jgi:hypothetical protein
MLFRDVSTQISAAFINQLLPAMVALPSPPTSYEERSMQMNDKWMLRPLKGQHLAKDQ